MIDDEDLKRMGLFDNKTDLYKIDKELLYFRNESLPKKEKLVFNKHNKSLMREKGILESFGMGGSNCWAVSGEISEKGKPILSCDPHMNKWLQSNMYLTRLSWGEDYYLAGGSTPGNPLFTYVCSFSFVFGVSVLNTDVDDLYVE